MEAENKKVRDKARKERNEAVRNLIQFVRKRDKRVAEYSKKLQEKAEINKKKTLEFQKKQREERKKLFAAGDESAGGFCMSEMEEQLRQLEGEYTDSESASDTNELGSDEEEEIGEELDDLYCVACDKVFRTVGAKDNHETSRKHKDNLEKLIEEMNEEEGNVEEVDAGRICESNEESMEVNEVPSSESGEHEEKLVGHIIPSPSELKSKSKSKKQKKKQKKKSPNLLNESESECDENQFLKAASDSSDEGNNRKRKGKGKNKKKQKKEKSPDEINNDVQPTDIENLKFEKDDANYVIKEDGLNISKEVEETDKKVPSDDEVTIIKASANEELNPEISHKKSQKTKSKDKEDLLNSAESAARGNLTCAQCKGNFPSKNKLYNHLKSSGHAVYLPTTDDKPAVSSKSKKKNKK